jgi:hypothetical protein
MQTHRLISLLLFVGLAGCTGSRSEYENSILRQQVLQLTNQIETKQLEMRYFERQAAIAAGCDAWIPICPSSITAPGHRAQAAGYGGATDWLCWVVFVIKFSMLGIALASAIIVFLLARVWLIFPAKSKLMKARQVVESANVNVKQTHALVAAAKVELSEILNQITISRRMLSVLEEQLSAQKLAIEQQQTGDAYTEAGKLALDGFS